MNNKNNCNELNILQKIEDKKNKLGDSLEDVECFLIRLTKTYKGVRLYKIWKNR